jgi:hypothetical protein
MFFSDDETAQLEFTLEDNIENRSRQSPPAPGTEASPPTAGGEWRDRFD